MPDTTISYNWHPLPRVYLYLFGAFFIGLGILAIWLLAVANESSRWPTIIGYLFLVCGFFMFVDQQTRIDTESHQVFREGRLFGWLRLWFTRRSLGDFTAVTCRRVKQYRENDSIFVGLRRQNGQVMELCYFTVANGYPCEQARREAQTLAQKIGLPLNEDVA
jgi:hypothetical protein